MLPLAANVSDLSFVIVNVATAAGALAPVLVMLVKARRRIEVVHDIANGRLNTALRLIKELQQERAENVAADTVPLALKKETPTARTRRADRSD